MGGFSSEHPTGCNYLFGDGRADSISNCIDMKVLQQLANRADGSVEVLAEGPESDLAALLTALREGPSSAQVTEVEVTWLAPRGQPAGFAIRSGSHSGD